jgi:alkylated DNA repair protein (DNA oxidative demethylase)
MEAFVTRSLFDEAPTPYMAPEVIAPGAVLLRGFACDVADALVQAAEQVIAAAPLRHLITPGGRTMSVGMTNCGGLGWVSDRTGYRYSATDPLSGQPWPPMPDCFLDMAVQAALEYAQCQTWEATNAAPGRPKQVQPPRGAAQHTQWQAWGPHFRPDACLINSYAPGARLSLHQDKDEGDMTAPIVSVSLGLPAIFLFGTTQRSEYPARYRLVHGDVAVWGGPSRLAYHGVAPLADGDHVRLGRRRINLTFRRAGPKD